MNNTNKILKNDTLKANKSVYDLSLMSIMLTLMVVCSKITIPISFIPLTLQTFCVFLIPIIIGSKRAFFTFLAYIIFGLLGLPIFSNGGGFSYIYQPSFGFIIGFMFTSIIVGMVNENNKKITNYLLLITGITIMYFIALIYMAIILNGYLKLDKSFLDILKIGFIPFVLKDMISALIAKIIGFRIKKVVTH